MAPCPRSDPACPDDGYLGYHFDHLDKAQDTCTKYRTCSGVTYLRDDDYGWYEPRFGEPKRLAKQEELPKIYQTSSNDEVMSFTKDKSDKCKNAGGSVEIKFLEYLVRSPI